MITKVWSYLYSFLNPHYSTIVELESNTKFLPLHTLIQSVTQLFGTLDCRSSDLLNILDWSEIYWTENWWRTFAKWYVAHLPPERTLISHCLITTRHLNSPMNLSPSLVTKCSKFNPPIAHHSTHAHRSIPRNYCHVYHLPLLFTFDHCQGPQTNHVPPPNQVLPPRPNTCWNIQSQSQSPACHHQCDQPFIVYRHCPNSPEKCTPNSHPEEAQPGYECTQ